jgi:hypothetical protein
MTIRRKPLSAAIVRLELSPRVASRLCRFLDRRLSRGSGDLAALRHTVQEATNELLTRGVEGVKVSAILRRMVVEHALERNHVHRSLLSQRARHEYVADDVARWAAKACRDSRTTANDRGSAMTGLIAR